MIPSRLHTVIFIAAMLSVVSPPSRAEPFDWIMASLVKAGPLANNDGHEWSFRSRKPGAWEVEGAQGEVASVTSGGANKIIIDGFPSRWRANGTFVFSRTEQTCKLVSDHSGHALQWRCP